MDGGKGRLDEPVRFSEQCGRFRGGGEAQQIQGVAQLRKSVDE
jgi:hypothetical protein